MYQILSSFHLDGYLDSRIGGRSDNQDACGFSDTPIGALVVVCDGMGGMNGGSVASTTAVQTIVSHFTEATGKEDPVALIKEAVTAANKAILEASQADPNLSGMGTTLVLTLTNEDCAYVVSIGDSRVYQLRSKKKVFRTEDDSVVFQLVKSKVITEEEARTADSSNIITKALGISEELEFNIISLPYDKRDRFMLCSDGIWGSMPEKDLLAIIAQKGDLSILFERLLNRVERIGKKNNPSHYDNFTAAVYDIGRFSKKRSAMEKKLTILSLVLALLLVLSVGVSYYLYRASHPAKEDSQEQTAPEIPADSQESAEESTTPLPEESAAKQ